MTDPSPGDRIPERDRRAWWPLAALAAVTYLPLALTQPGWVSADTKTYLYLDPGRLLGRAWSMWDPQVGLGTVTHQSIGYLWPMGPWYWLAEQLGLPDWLAQRLWWGTLLTAAGAGVAYLLRRFSWPPPAVWAAAFAYALSPYVLTHIGRLSAILLPFVGLPWLLGLTVQALRHRGWRHPALFALVVATVGSTNLTALVLVGLGPLAWVVAAVVTGTVAPGVAARTVAKLAALTVPLSAWWLAGLSVQASHGIDIVRYTETAETVASASTASEVLRGLGYWFFYGGDQLDLWVAAGWDYTQRSWLIALTFLLPAAALLAAVSARWRHRGTFVAIVVLGAFVAVGGHPWDSAPPLGRLIQAFLATERGLAFRSLPRAVPLVALGLAVLLGAAVAALHARRARHGLVAAAAVALAALLALPPLWEGTMVSEQLRRREELPAYWHDAARALDERDDGTRALELPGIDFADYRWGATVDPITPGLTDRPYVAREHVPYGTPPSANLLNALDLPLQERTLDVTALAPLARLMRVGDVVVRSDLQYERYNTARPRLVWQAVTTAPGLGQPIAFGTPTPNEPDPRRQLYDATWLEHEDDLPHPPPVAIVPVEGPVPILATKPAEGAVVLAGDGYGVVNAAAAGLLEGTELIRYSAALDDDELLAELDRGAVLVLTDTNRRRGERWSAVRQTRGYTETADHVDVERDPTDNRLPVFDPGDWSAWTVAEHRGGITARASSYGNPIGLISEHRPAGAVDGDPTTAWKTGEFSDARGERLVLTLDEPREIDQLVLLQPIDGRSNRHLTEVDVRIDGGPAHRVVLDETSLRAPGQVVPLPPQVGQEVEIELVADTAGNRPRWASIGAVGFAEVAVGSEDPPRLDEVIRLPVDLLDRAGSRGADRPLAVVLTRLRQDVTDLTREDEERSMARTFDLPAPRRFEVRGTARLSGRAPLDLLDALVGQARDGLAVTATSTLTGTLTARPIVAVDGDPTTVWRSEHGLQEGQRLRIERDEPMEVRDLELVVVADGRHSVPTEVAVHVDGREVARASLGDLADGDDADHTETVTVPVPPTRGRVVELEVVSVREVLSNSWESGRPLAHPIGIAEVGLGALTEAPIPTVDTGCRDDLLQVDGRPVPVRVTGPIDAALAGDPLEVSACGPLELSAGQPVLRTAAGHLTGVDLDQLVLTDGWDGAPATRAPEPVTVLDEAPDEVRVEVTLPAEDEPTWLVLGQSLNDGWRATVAETGEDLGPPQLVDGFANGWLLPTGAGTATITLRFEPQRRVDLALGLSALGAAVALALVWRRPQPLPVADDHPLPSAPVLRPLPRAGDARLRPIEAGATGVGGAILAALVLPPIAAVAVGALVGAAARWPAARWALRLAPAALVLVVGAYVVVWQRRYGILPGLEWPAELRRGHPVAATAVVLVGADAALSALLRRRTDRSEREH